MKIVIAGAGEVGTFLTKMLCDGSHDIVVIDTNEEKLRMIDSHFDVLTVKGSASSLNVLKSANINKVDLFIAITELEEMNLTAAILAKHLGAQRTVARVDNHEYVEEESQQYFHTLGIDHMIYPEILGAREVVRLLKQSGTSKVFDFSDGKLSLVAVRLEENTPIANKTLKEAIAENPEFDYRVVALTRNNETIIPSGDDRFRAGDLAYIISTPQGMPNLMAYSGKEQRTIKNLMILGGSRIGRKTAYELEKNSPIMQEHKRENPGGISYKVINVVAEAGDVSPTTPIGVNLPNANWIRAQHGSKAVSLGNIEHAYDMGYKSSGTLQEFYLPEQQKNIKKYGDIAGRLSTGLHEVIGHASGKLMPGVGTPKETLKNYASTLEETRADLVALYYIGDQHLVDMGLTESTDVIKAEYDGFMVNGLVRQLARLKLGDNIEEAHMRNRQLIAKWAYEKGKAENVVEMKKIEGKTFVQINDYNKLKELFGQLLSEIQRIKSEGDFEAGKNMVETYGVKVDQEIHKEVLDRYSKLEVAAYGGFINPKLVPVLEGENIVDIKVEYPADFKQQMLEYSEKYATLPSVN